MAYEIIDIPGGSTKYEGNPRVIVRSVYDGPMSLIIMYHANATEDKIGLMGEIIFRNVLEYRWIADFVDYDDFYEHDEDYEFSLIIINNSKYVERMASTGPYRDHIGKRFGDVIAEDNVKHYRLVFDDYGQFDVIALSVSVGTVDTIPQNNFAQ